MAKRGVNKVIILGRLGQDPEMRAMPNGDAVTSVSLATSEVWNDKQTGEKKEATEWHRVVLWRKPAEIVAQYCHKGDELYIEGKLKTRKWTDQQGIERYTTEIVADDFQLRGNKQEGGQQQQRAPASQQQRHSGTPQRQQAPQNHQFDDDIPF